MFFCLPGPLDRVFFYLLTVETHAMRLYKIHNIDNNHNNHLPT